MVDTTKKNWRSYKFKIRESEFQMTDRKHLFITFFKLLFVKVKKFIKTQIFTILLKIIKGRYIKAKKEFG